MLAILPSEKTQLVIVMSRVLDQINPFQCLHAHGYPIHLAYEAAGPTSFSKVCQCLMSCFWLQVGILCGLGMPLDSHCPEKPLIAYMKDSMGSMISPVPRLLLVLPAQKLLALMPL